MADAMVNVESYAGGDMSVLVPLWEESVLSTHDFLTAEDVAFYRGRMAECYLPSVDVWVVRGPSGAVEAFMGLSDDTIEMLFVRPSAQGCGYGTALVAHALSLGKVRVDVNEQNVAARGFYLARGFVECGRDALDSDGRPFPIVHMIHASVSGGRE